VVSERNGAIIPTHPIREQKQDPGALHRARWNGSALAPGFQLAAVVGRQGQGVAFPHLLS
jgi:hypothetical protein